MPLLKSATRVVEPPPEWWWGTPSGRVRHIHILPDKLFAVYVIEQEPALERLRFMKGGVVYEHKVFMPWRYTFIRVRHDTRVEGGNMGFLFFATGRATDLDSEVLRQAFFPNVFENGGICIGYTTTSMDRSPVRSAWRALRYLYDIPGNQWMIYSGFGCLTGKSVSKMDDHKDHSIGSECRWAEMTKEEVLAADLPPPEGGANTINMVCKNSRWTYQGGREWSDESAEKKIKELGGTW